MWLIYKAGGLTLYASSDNADTGASLLLPMVLCFVAGYSSETVNKALARVLPGASSAS